MQTNDNPRVALSKILVLAEYLQTRCGVPKSVANEISQIEQIANAALSAPPRNCDLAQDWVRDLYAHFQPPASIRREMPPEWVDSVMAFCRWLVAPAAEKEGGAE